MIVTVFRARLKDDVGEEYYALLAEAEPRLMQCLVSSHVRHLLRKMVSE